MSERPLTDLDAGQLKSLFSAALDAEARSPDNQVGPPDRRPCPELASQRLGCWIDRYKLVSILGEGGMAVVYLAEQEYPVARRVALKLIKPGMDSRQVIARFEMERRTLALLSHPNIAHIFDAGTTEDGRPYFVMELVEGPPITEYCDRNTLTIDDRLALFRHVCEGIHYAHQKGIIHRDIKASNVLITVEEGRPVPKIIDFGVARAISPQWTEHTSMTEQGQWIGTPEYMSPEQVNLGSEDIDVRSDVYALGVLLYVLLTGVMPYETSTLHRGGIDALRRVILEEEPKAPSTRLVSLGDRMASITKNRRTETKALAKRLRQELDWIPLKAMAKDREQRYRSAAELADDIQNYLNGDPLIAGPPSSLYRARKFVRRNRTSLVAAVIVGLAITVGAILSLAMYIRAEVQTEQARAVSGLLNNTVLQSLDPDRRQGGEITVLSVLDAISGALEGRFNDAPLIEAEVRHRLGWTYETNGQYDAALHHLQRALEIRRRELGDHDPLTMETMLRLAWALSGADRTREAEPLLLEVVAEYGRRFGEEDARTIAAKRTLIGIYVALGEYDTALPLCQETLNTARRALGHHAELTVGTMDEMGALNRGQEDYGQAEKWFREALQSSIRGLGEDHPVTWGITARLGQVYMLQGRYAEAERLITESIARRSRILGEGNWRNLRVVETLVRLYVAWDRLEEAAKWRARLVTTRPADASSPTGSIRYDEKTDAYALRGTGIDMGHVFDEFCFAHKTLTGDGSITARIDRMEHIDSRDKAGVTIRKNLDPTSEHASVIITPTGMVAFQYRNAPRGASSSRYLGRRATEFPHWVRLTRRGNMFTAEHSSDGVSWDEVRGSGPNRSGPVEIAMDEAVRIGLAVTSLDVSRMAQAWMSNVTVAGDVSPQGPFAESEDIGLQTLLSSVGKTGVRATLETKDASAASYPGAEPPPSVDGEPTAGQLATLALRHGASAGRLTYDEATRTYAVVGSGRGIGSTSDQFHFAYKRLTGDGSIAARIESIEPVDPWTTAGVMIRNTLNSDSEHAAVFITPAYRICLQHRSTAGQNAIDIHTDPNAVTLPHWVRLIREGDAFRAQHSKDGHIWKDLEGNDLSTPGAKTWTVQPKVQMNKTVHLGLAVTSHASSLTAEAKMSNVTVTGDIQPPGEFLWSEDIGFQVIILPKK